MLDYIMLDYRMTVRFYQRDHIQSVEEQADANARFRQRAYSGLADCYDEIVRQAEYDSPKRKPNAELAITYFKQAIRLEPDFADAHAGIGESYSMLRRYDEALSAFQLAIRLEPKNAERYRDLASTYELANRYDEAISVYKSAAALTSLPEDYFHVGEAYERSGNLSIKSIKESPYEAAITNYKQVIEMLHNNGFASFFDAFYGEAACERLLDCFVRLNKVAEGIEYFRDQAIMLAHDNTKTVGGKTDYPATAWSHYALGMLYMHSSDTKAALEQYKILRAQGKGKPAELAEKLFSHIYK